LISIKGCAPRAWINDGLLADAAPVDLKYAFGFLGQPLGEQGIAFPNIFRLAASNSLLVCLNKGAFPRIAVSLSKALWLQRSGDESPKILFDQGKANRREKNDHIL
jgi:hypothetical protein